MSDTIRIVRQSGAETVSVAHDSAFDELMAQLIEGSQFMELVADNKDQIHEIWVDMVPPGEILEREGWHCIRVAGPNYQEEIPMEDILGTLEEFGFTEEKEEEE